MSERITAAKAKPSMHFTVNTEYGETKYGVAHPWIDDQPVVEPYRITTLTATGPELDGDEKINQTDKGAHAPFPFPKQNPDSLLAMVPPTAIVEEILNGLRDEVKEMDVRVVEEACLGQSHCCLPVSTDNFADDPCRGTVKTLAVILEGCAEHRSLTRFKRHCSLLGQPLLCDEDIEFLSALSLPPAEARAHGACSAMWRGVRGMLKPDFWNRDELGHVCAVETIFMSTSRQRMTPIAYMDTHGPNVLWQLQPRKALMDCKFSRLNQLSLKVWDPV